MEAAASTDVEALKKLAEYRLSIQDYSEAIRLNPNDDESYTERATMYFALNDGEEVKAIADYNSALKINPNNVCAYESLGIIYKSMGQYPSAIYYYTKALDIEKVFHCFWHRGEAYEAIGGSNNALANFVEAAKLSRFMLWDGVGDKYKEQGKLRQAIDAYTRKIMAEPDASAYISRANVYRKNGDHKKALADYSKAIELVPSNGFYYKYRADTHRELKNNEAALADYTRAIYLIAESDSAGEDSDWAEKAADKVLAELYDARSDVNKALENFDQAKSDYRKALRLVFDNGEDRNLFDEIE